MEREMPVGTDGRKWERRKVQRPRELAAAARAEFLANGFAATRLEDVARRAGVSKGTIYRYFDSKETLFEAVLTSQISPVLSQVKALMESWSGSHADLLRLVLSQLYRRIVSSDYAALVRVILAEGARFPNLFGIYHREVVAQGQSILGTILDRGVRAGEFREGPAARQPVAVIGPAIAAMLWQITFQPIQPIDPERFLEAHLDLVLHGVRTRRRAEGRQAGNRPTGPEDRREGRRPGSDRVDQTGDEDPGRAGRGPDRVYRR